MCHTPHNAQASFSCDSYRISATSQENLSSGVFDHWQVRLELGCSASKAS